jgi:hypothetical protein
MASQYTRGKNQSHRRPYLREESTAARRRPRSASWEDDYRRIPAWGYDYGKKIPAREDDHGPWVGPNVRRRESGEMD